MRLKELRKKLNITQAELAKILNINQNTYSYWESGRTKIDNSALSKLADYFGVTVDYLLERTVEPTNSEQDKQRELSSYAQQLLSMYDMLDEHDQGRVLGYTEALANKYKK